MSEGEFSFTLTERRDKHGNLYLFAGVRILNSVLFVRPEAEVPGRPRRWQAVLKPYRPKGEDDNFESAWTENLNNHNENSTQGDSNDEREQSTKPQRRSR